MNIKRLRIADIVFGITSNMPLDLVEWPKSYGFFLTNDKVQVTLKARYDGVPRRRFSKEELLFDSQMLWRLYYQDQKYHLVLRSPEAGPMPYRMATFSQSFFQSIIYSRSPATGSKKKGLADPLEFPLSELLMINLLGQGRGIMLHACGLVYQGRGYLFAGNSTHGKTTMSKIWQPHSLILNDDRIVVRKQNNAYYMYGTPWHGDNRRISPRKVKLHAIFFLHHSPRNYLRPRGAMQAATMLLTRSFPPLWDEDKMQHTVDFCSKLAESIPCYELGFVPDKKVVDFILKHCLEKGGTYEIDM